MLFISTKIWIIEYRYVFLESFKWFKYCLKLSMFHLFLHHSLISQIELLLTMNTMIVGLKLFIKNAFQVIFKYNLFYLTFISNPYKNAIIYNDMIILNNSFSIKKFSLFLRGTFCITFKKKKSVLVSSMMKRVILGLSPKTPLFASRA